MENKAHALVAGLFVVALTAMLLGLAAWLTRESGQRDRYQISTRESITGLQEQAPVRYRGVDVGKVTHIGFDPNPKAQGSVLVDLEVSDEAPVSTETFATLAFQGVTGLAFVQLDDDGKAAPALTPDDQRPPRIPLKPGLLGNLMSQGTAILEKVDRVAQRVDQVLGEDNQQRLALAMDNIGRAADGVGKLAVRLDGTVQQRLDPALASVPVLAADASRALRSVERAAEKVDRASDRYEELAARLVAKDGPIDRLAEGTTALSHAADAFNASTLPRINRVTEDTSRAVRQLGRTANAINDNPQSLLFGSGPAQPGPGEPGFVAPGGVR